MGIDLRVISLGWESLLCEGDRFIFKAIVKSKRGSGLKMGFWRLFFLSWAEEAVAEDRFGESEGVCYGGKEVG